MILSKVTPSNLHVTVEVFSDDLHLVFKRAWIDETLKFMNNKFHLFALTPPANVKLYEVKMHGNHPPVNRTDDAHWMSLKWQTLLVLTSRKHLTWMTKILHRQCGDKRSFQK